MIASIPTASRHRLPKSLSYPIGAQDASAFLATNVDVAFELRFWQRPVFRHSAWQALLASKGELEILRVERPLREERWVVNVYAVPFEERANARALLRSVAFPEFVGWLRHANKHCFSAHYDLGSRSLRVSAHVAQTQRADERRQSVGGRNGMNRS